MSELFIGRMSINENDDRFNKKYYDAGSDIENNPRKQNWANGLKVNDYVLLSVSFIQSDGKGKTKYRNSGKDNKVVLWKVKKINDTKTEFEEINSDIKIKLHKLASLEIFKVTKVTTNLAMKSSNSNAFWKLELTPNFQQWQKKEKDYYHPNMKVSYSIKYVLPALVPEFENAYKELDLINNGGEAMDAFANLSNITDEELKQRYRDSLLEYCKLYTLSMVKVLEKLRENI